MRLRRPTRRGLARAFAAAVVAWVIGSGVTAGNLTSAAHHRVEAPRGLALRPWAVEGGGPRLVGWSTEVPAARAVVVFAHGYRNDRRTGLVLAGPLAERGIRLMAFDFRGHGESGGDLVTLGVREADDVGRVLARARAEGLPVGWAGFSMGAVAYLLSGREADAAVLDSPYAVLRDGLRSRFESVPAPLTWLTWAFMGLRLGRHLDTVRPVDRARALTRPTRFVFAEHDGWVPPSAQRAYRERLCARCDVVLLRGAEHGNHLSRGWARAVADHLAHALLGP